MNSKKIKSLGYADYQTYLNSSHWQSIKILFKRSRYATLKNGEICCFSCKSKDKIHLHHKTYENLGQEKLSDLVYLCEFCHSITHKIANSGKIELEKAHLYVESYKKGQLYKKAVKKTKKKVKVYKLTTTNGKINYRTQKEKELIKKAILADKCTITFRIDADFKPS